MKKKRLFVPLLAVLVLGLSLGLVSMAAATPSKTSPCSNCHDLSSNVTVTATLVSASAATSVYSIAVNNPYGTNAWAVFQGSTKQAGTSGNGANVTLPNGVTSTIFGVSGNGNGTQGYAVRSVTPAAAPVTDLTAPSTTSDAVATYTGSASIHLTASDNNGGSGVAHTYYILDGGTQAEGLTVSTSVVGAHTLEFWSVDVAGNAESPHKTASFEVAALAPDFTAPITTSDAKATYVGSAAISLSAVDDASGVAHTYYVLDGNAQAEGTSVGTSIVGAHTLEFWSVDVAGNAESPHGIANFTVTAAPVATKTYTYTYKFKVKKKTYKKLKAVLTSKANGKRYTVAVSRKGVATFKRIPAGTYKLSTTGNKRFKFKAKTVKIGLAKKSKHHDKH